MRPDLLRDLVKYWGINGPGFPDFDDDAGSVRPEDSGSQRERREGCGTIKNTQPQQKRIREYEIIREHESQSDLTLVGSVTTTQSERGVRKGFKAGYEQGFDDGFDEGYDVGFEEGYDDGYRAREKEIRQAKEGESS